MNTLSWKDPIFRVLISIYDHNERDEPIWDVKLFDIFQDLEKQKVNSILDQLSDLNTIEGRWKVIDGHWRRTLWLTNAGEILIQCNPLIVQNARK